MCGLFIKPFKTFHCRIAAAFEHLTHRLALREETMHTSSYFSSSSVYVVCRLLDAVRGSCISPSDGIDFAGGSERLRDLHFKGGNVGIHLVTECCHTLRYMDYLHLSGLQFLQEVVHMLALAMAFEILTYLRIRQHILNIACCLSSICPILDLLLICSDQVLAALVLDPPVIHSSIASIMSSTIAISLPSFLSRIFIRRSNRPIFSSKDNGNAGP